MHDVSEAIAKLFSLSRHEFINHLQLINGLAQLNKTEKLQSCVRKASEEIQQLGRLANCGDPRLALLIYEIFIRVPENSLTVECNGAMPLLSPVSLAQATELLDACKEYLLRGESVPLTIMLRGGDAPSVSLRFSSASEKQPEWSCLLENAAVHCFAAALASEGTTLTLLLDKQQQISEQ